MSIALEPNDLDRRIWAEELDGFVPRRIFDAHTHVYRWAHNLDPAKQSGPHAVTGGAFPEADWALLNEADRLLMPGREVHRLTFGFPFAGACDFGAANRFTAEQAAGDPGSAALMLVHPSMTERYLEERVARHGFLGFKPYRFYAVTGDPVECRITDFLPEQQIRVADRLGLLVVLHLAKRDWAADADNLADLERLTEQYPRVKWILAHLRGAILRR